MSKPSGAKLRISLTEKNGEIKGKIESEGALSFTLESLALSIEKLAPDPVDFAHDLYLFIKKEMQNENCSFDIRERHKG